MPPPGSVDVTLAVLVLGSRVVVEEGGIYQTVVGSGLFVVESAATTPPPTPCADEKDWSSRNAGVRIMVGNFILADVRCRERSF